MDRERADPSPGVEWVERWAACGAMALSGRPDGPGLGPPDALVPWLDRATASLRLEGEPLVLLTERAAAMGLTRRGATSCGGATRLLAAADGWIALSLARDDDVDLLPAWLEAPVDDAAGGDDEGPPWAAVASLVAARSRASLIERAALLGLPAAALGEAAGGDAAPAVAWGRPDGEVQAPGAPSLAGAKVVDLSSLWAGPLCGDLLAAAGAEVVKVESTGRPDGARRGDPTFFDRLNARKRSVAVDFTTPDGRRILRALLDRADIVIEASRPRALAQLGVDAPAWVAGRAGRVWASITGHGRDGGGASRVAFGDDAAVAGGLVVWEAGAPRFCADAVADPLAGVATAAAVVEARRAGRGGLLAVSMAGVAAEAAGPTIAWTGPQPIEVRAPRSRPAIGRAAASGADTARVLEDWGVEP